MNTLSIEQLEEGRIKVLENANELIEEAEILISLGRAARDYSLAHLACEELAKIPMLVRVAIESLRGLDVDWTKLDKRLRSHTEKIMGGFLLEYLFDPNVENDADVKHFFEKLKKTGDFNLQKNYSLYTNIKKGKFLKPSELISKEQAEELIKIAKKRFILYEIVEIGNRERLEKFIKTEEFEALWSQLAAPLTEKK